MSTCIFCRIAAGEIPARIVRTDEDFVAFHDVAPQAPTHVLIIPRRHLASLADARPEDAALLGRLVTAAAEIATELGVERGFRLVVNSGAPAGQSVFHLHLHLLAGRKMSWPPG
jgi:histidine triad (HIT) family protein